MVQRCSTRRQDALISTLFITFASCMVSLIMWGVVFHCLRGFFTYYLCPLHTQCHSFEDRFTALSRVPVLVNRPVDYNYLKARTDWDQPGSRDEDILDVAIVILRFVKALISIQLVISALTAHE